MRHTLRAVLLLTFTALGCDADRRPVRQPGRAPVANHEATPASVGTSPTGDSVHEGLLPLPAAADSTWREWRGPGFVLRYPPAARIELHADTAVIRGPTVRATHPNAEIGTRVGPSYELVVTWWSNPRGLTTAAWVDSVRAEANAQMPADDPDSLGYLGPPDTLVLEDGARALRLQPFCGDCAVSDVYVARPQRVVLMESTWDISIPGDQRTQDRLYDAIRRTFRWAKQ